MDKAELIRHEIEKRRDHNLAIGNPLFAAMAEEDIELLLFIDSMQEEPAHRTKADVDAAMREVEEKAKLFTVAMNGKSSEQILAEMRGEEPISEDLEEEIKTCFLNNTCKVSETSVCSFSVFGRIARHFANWQKHQDDLIIKQTKTYYRLLGKQQMKEEMMKDAVNMTVGYWMPNGLRLDVDETENDWGLDEGDKVKVIVIKEE